ncbi:MAG: DUF697 domain-containing protein [Firmicutes bacterium]|nr:DUF697 domain-containing protein [Bacillota bacterium]
MSRVQEQTTYGIPAQQAKTLEIVTEEEEITLDTGFDEAEDPDLQLDLESDFQFEPWLARIVSSREAAALVGGIVLLIGLFVLTQTLSAVATLMSLPQPLRLGGYVLLGAVLVGLAWCAIRLLRPLWRLRRSPQLRSQSLLVLAQRQRAREKAADDLAEAKRLLTDILQAHPVMDPAAHRRILKFGFQVDELESIRRGALRILEEEMTTYESWLERYLTLFVRPLEQVAKRRVKQYAVRVGALTAALPTDFLTTAAVLYNSTLMVHDLCQIFGLRTGRFGALTITTRVLTNVLASAYADDAAEAVGDIIAEALPEGLGVGGKVVGNVVKPVGEAAINGALLLRLGHRTIALLTPCK